MNDTLNVCLPFCFFTFNFSGTHFIIIHIVVFYTVFYNWLFQIYLPALRICGFNLLNLFCPFNMERFYLLVKRQTQFILCNESEEEMLKYSTGEYHCRNI